MDESGGIAVAAGGLHGPCAIGLGSPWDLVSGRVVARQLDRRADYLGHPCGPGGLSHMATATVLATARPQPHVSPSIGGAHPQGRPPGLSTVLFCPLQPFRFDSRNTPTSGSATLTITQSTISGSTAATGGGLVNAAAVVGL